MIKKNAIIIITSIYGILVFSTGCNSVTRTIGKSGDEILKTSKNQADEVVETFDNQGSKAATLASKQSEKVLKRCKSEAKNAVKAIKRQSITEISQDYLIQEAKDAAQKCAVGGLGDSILDQLANDAVTEVEQESQSESENEFSN